MQSADTFKAPLVVGIRQFPDWHEAGSVQATISGLGQNTGNMMFTQSLLSVIDGAKWGSFAVSPGELEGRDAIVVACANWLNNFEDFGWLADRLEKTALPVVLVGIGAQSSLAMEMPCVKSGTLRLLSLAVDRSHSISARGNFTSEVLEKLGYRNVVPTGCPSLLLAGSQGPMISHPADVSYATTCVHATRHGIQPPKTFDALLYRLAFVTNMDLVLQSETPDIYLSLQKDPPEGAVDTFSQALLKSYGASELGPVSAYLQRHGRSFTNFGDWIAYMKTKSFCFGTRIHGTVAALVAGTSATLIVHDSRTLEMALSMSLPYIQVGEVESLDVSNVRSLLRPGAVGNLVSNYPRYRKVFEQFFVSNNLVLN